METEAFVYIDVDGKPIRVVAEINSTKIEKDFGSYSRRIKGRILIVFGILCNAEDG
ncbi:MAG: hypothetical protein U9R20_00245 [Thermodesulfobacteriota bacterium]|nr:hypothetical protein [Thermodesulfobacteriota bacterium]